MDVAGGLLTRSLVKPILCLPNLPTFGHETALSDWSVGEGEGRGCRVLFSTILHLSFGHNIVDAALAPIVSVANWFFFCTITSIKEFTQVLQLIYTCG